MFYYLYQITNIVNDKIYVGVHKTKSLDDGYMGSGKVVKRAITKHGILNFKKDILEFFDTSEAMYAKEAEVINEEFLQREDVYNLRRGGFGGFEYINGASLNYGGKDGNSRGGRKGGKIAGNIYGKITGIKNLEIGRKMFPNGTFLGKYHSEDTKQKMRKSKNCGENNSQFGMMWITNEIESKKIKKTDLIPEGFRKGRVC